MTPVDILTKAGYNELFIDCLTFALSSKRAGKKVLVKQRNTYYTVHLISLIDITSIHFKTSVGGHVYVQVAIKKNLKKMAYLFSVCQRAEIKNSEH